MQKNIYLYRITLNIENENFYYFGIRTCFSDPKNDFSYVGSPKTYAHFWKKANSIKKDILSSVVLTNETFSLMQAKEIEIIRKAQEKYGIYEEDTHGKAINNCKCLNVGIFPTLAMTETIKRKIGEKNSIHQKGHNNSQYGTCWIRHPDFGPKRIHKKMLIEYLEQGWFLGRADWKHRIPRLTCHPSEFPGNLEKTKKYKKDAVELFEKLAKGNYKSISDYIRKTNYRFSHQNLIILWKKYIPGFSDVLLAHKSFSSKSALSVINRIRSVGQSG